MLLDGVSDSGSAVTRVDLRLSVCRSLRSSCPSWTLNERRSRRRRPRLRLRLGWLERC